MNGNTDPITNDAAPSGGVLTDDTLRVWRDHAPQLTGDPEHDWPAVQRYLDRGEQYLAELGPKAGRSAGAQLLAATIHDSSRAQRHVFMQAHAGWIYRQLTLDLTVRLRLQPLYLRAALAFPGLVPSPSAMADELLLAQRDKEAREIDQGIFFSALLADRVIGVHLAQSMLRPCPEALELLLDFARDGRMQLSKVVIERHGHVAYVTVNNPECLNAEDNQLIADMETAVDLVLLDSQVHVAVLRGGEMSHPKYVGRRVFSAGINLKDLHAGKISFLEFLLRREMGYINKILRGVIVDDDDASSKVIEKPWVAAVDTFAIGGGAQLLLVFDHVVAAADSYFSLPAAQEGIVPGVANLRLTRSVGTRLARRIILGGQKIAATDAMAPLLFDRVVSPGEMEQAIEAAAAMLDSPAVVANRRMLTVAEEPLNLFCEYMAEFSHTQSTRMYCHDVLDKLERA